MSTLKLCTGCKRDLPLESFSRKLAAKDGVQSHCKECRKVYCKQHYDRNKKYYYDRNVQRRKIIRAWIIAHKSKLKCDRCGFDDWRALHFHHKDPDKKEFVIATVTNRGYSLEHIMREINKCEVVCANCHAIEHHTGE